jgi:hypothetical protein
MPEHVQKLARKGRKKRAWERAFLKILADSGNVTRAAEAAGQTRTNLYTHRERHPDFSQAWDSALETFADGIEQEAIRRAVKGVTRYKFYKGQPILHPDLCRCGHTWEGHELDAACREEGCRCGRFLARPYQEREYSDALLALLLKGLRPERYREGLGISAEEVDAFIEKRIAELAEERVEARMRQPGIRNGTAPHPPATTAGQEPALPNLPSASAAAGSPAQEQGTPAPRPAEGFPARPPWLQDRPPGENQPSSS